MATKIQLRRDTAADWTSANPTLAAGEFGYESDTTRFKIGDGATAWNSLAYKTGQGFNLVADDSATITVAEEGTLYVQGGTNVTTSTDSAGVLTINATGEVTASSTTTFTNKTFDVEGTGNSISNIDVADLKSGVLDTDLSSVSGSDDTLASAKAIKAYVDANAGGGGSTGDITFTGSTIQSPSNADITLEPGGTGNIVTPAITIQDNEITTNRSNDNLRLRGNGTGAISVGNDDFYGSNPIYQNYYGNQDLNKIAGFRFDQSVDANTAARCYGIGISTNTEVTGSSASNSNFRQRAMNVAQSVDMAGFSYTRSGLTRGPAAGVYATNIVNTGSSASTINAITGATNWAAAYADSSTYAAGDLTITHAIANAGTIELFSSSFPGNFTITNGYAFRSEAFIDGSNDTVTNMYGFYHGAFSSQTGTITNNYAFYDATNSLSVFGDIQTQAVSITDNEISANRSNDDLEISANGTGFVNISSDGTFSSQASSDFASNFGDISTRCKGVHLFRKETIGSALTSSSDRRQGHFIGQEYILGNYSSSDKDNRYRTQTVGCVVDLNGATVNSTNSFAGAMAAQGQVAVHNSDASNAGTIGNTIGMMAGSYHFSAQTVNVTNAHGVFSYVEQDDNGGDVNLTNAFSFKAQINKYHGTMTNGYAYYVDTNDATNKFAFYDNTASLSRFGAVILANVSDPSGVTDSSHIYAKDDGGSSEVHVRDEAGNITKISPHNKAGEWEYFSRNIKTGKTVRVNMERMIRKLEEVTGETFIENE